MFVVVPRGSVRPGAGGGAGGGAIAVADVDAAATAAEFGMVLFAGGLL